jgi:hypothetical protein
MKKTLVRLAFLAGVLGLASSPLLDPTPAYGHGPFCQNLNGGPCSPEGREQSCTDGYDGGPGLCVCNDSLWSCTGAP